MAENSKKNKKARAKKALNDSPKKVTSSRKNTSLRLEPDMLKRLKIRAIEEDSSVQQILERLVKQYLENKK